MLKFYLCVGAFFIAMTIKAQPTGSCCLAQGTCFPNLTQAQCQGLWTQGGTCDNGCPPSGACCTGSGGCIYTQLEALCTSVFNGKWFANQTNCSDEFTNANCRTTICCAQNKCFQGGTFEQCIATATPQDFYPNATC